MNIKKKKVESWGGFKQNGRATPSTSKWEIYATEATPGYQRLLPADRTHLLIMRRTEIAGRRPSFSHGTCLSLYGRVGKFAQRLPPEIYRSRPMLYQR